MRKIRKFGTALAVAAFVATGMMASSANLYAAGPGTGNGNSQTVLCGLAQRAIDTAATLLGADSDLVKYLITEAEANGCTIVIPS
jgi:hypothetical protein